MELDPERDEIASAHLDGESTPDEAALVAADPELAGRVDELRAVAGAVGADVDPAPDRVRDASIAAALAAYDEARSGRVGTDELVAARAKRQVQAQRWRVLSAAAVVVLIALALPLLASRMGDQGDDAALSTAGSAIGSDGRESGGASGDDGGDAAADAPTSGSDNAMSEPLYVDDVGTAIDREGLVALITPRLVTPSGAGSGDPQAEGSTTVQLDDAASLVCPLELPSPLGELAFAGSATYRDEPVELTVFDDGADETLVVTAIETCDLVEVIPL